MTIQRDMTPEQMFMVLNYDPTCTDPDHLSQVEAWAEAFAIEINQKDYDLMEKGEDPVPMQYIYALAGGFNNFENAIGGGYQGLVWFPEGASWEEWESRGVELGPLCFEDNGIVYWRFPGAPIELCKVLNMKWRR